MFIYHCFGSKLILVLTWLLTPTFVTVLCAEIDTDIMTSVSTQSVKYAMLTLIFSSQYRHRVSTQHSMLTLALFLYFLSHCVNTVLHNYGQIQFYLR